MHMKSESLTTAFCIKLVKVPYTISIQHISVVFAEQIVRNGGITML